MWETTGSPSIINPAVKVKRKKHFLAAAGACTSALQPASPLLPLLSARWAVERTPRAQTALSRHLLPLGATLLLWGDTGSAWTPVYSHCSHLLPQPPSRRLAVIDSPKKENFRLLNGEAGLNVLVLNFYLQGPGVAGQREWLQTDRE